jgi:hypothetical protein
MPDKTLQIYLPSFLFAFLLITFFWKWIRHLLKMNTFPNIEETTNYKRVKRVDIAYRIIFMVFAIMIMIYTFYPNLYFIFIPLEPFDHPIINSFGLLVLKIAFILVVTAQVHIDKELYKYSRDISNLKAMELVHYSERIMLGGLALMFVGIFVTITNIIAILAALLGLFVYLRVFPFRNFIRS